MMNIYVGNIPYAATETDLEELFQEYGPVATATIIRDRYDGRSKGFGFVEMENREDGERAIEALDDQKMMGRSLKVNPARPRGQRREPRYDERRGNDRNSSGTSNGKTFHNPYTFVPTPPRPLKNIAGKFAGDFNPLDKGLDHDSLKDGLWTGHIPITLKTVTPLVLLKTEGEALPPEEPYDVLNYIPESSLRGMLRSAYEVVTNSRYACFHNPDKLTYRVGRDKLKYGKSPEELLNASLKPAKQRSEMSPSDRLFGWVLQKGDQDTDTEDENKRGYKGRIRVVCENASPPDIIEDFSNDPLPLTILGQPKPEQARFYVAKDTEGNPQDSGISKSDAGYKKGKGLRGRKHYWHHIRLERKNNSDYWNPSGKNRIREYIRVDRKTDPQNRSIKGWIKPGIKFKASLYLQNLQPQEVGALLWLLTFPENYYFRLGYGKPLGFGSVRMEVDTERLINECLPLGTGENWKAYYAELSACLPSKLGASEQSKCIQEFQESLKNAYQEQNFDNLSFIKGFKRVLKVLDSDDPIHYPRRERIPDPEGKNYEWFMDNENGRERYEDGRRMALPAVTDEDGLPYNPSKPRQK